jgi:dihydroorotase
MDGDPSSREAFVITRALLASLAAARRRQLATPNLQPPKNGNLGIGRWNQVVAAGLCCAVVGVAGLAVVAQVQPQTAAQSASPKYDLLLRGGHVIDARNKISAIRDVAIANGKIAAVEAKINPADALKTVDVSGLHVTPGLIDIHTHVYTGTGERNSYAGDNSVPPDGFTFRVGVTTIADAGCAGWRNFEDFKDRIIDRSKTRVLAYINIVGNRMRGGKFEQNLEPRGHGGEADG